MNHADELLPRSMQVRLGGARTDIASCEHVFEKVAHRLDARDATPLFLASANLDHVRHYGRRSGRFRAFDDQVGVEWLVLLDGMPLVWLSRRLLGLDVPLLTGSDLLPPLLYLAATRGGRLGVLGGSEATHERLRARLHRELPTLTVAGMWSPTRQELQSDARCGQLADEVRDAEVDLLCVSLGKPRQEEFLLQHGLRTGARVAVAFGAATDFYAGTAERAPEWVRGSGWEWAYRLVHEPRRLARRYVVEGPREAVRLLADSGFWVQPEVAQAVVGHQLSPVAAAARVSVEGVRSDGPRQTATSWPGLVSVPQPRRASDRALGGQEDRRRGDRRKVSRPVTDDRRLGVDRRRGQQSGGPDGDGRLAALA